jgi:hypothetical protein
MIKDGDVDVTGWQSLIDLRSHLAFGATNNSNSLGKCEGEGNVS